MHKNGSIAFIDPSIALFRDARVLPGVTSVCAIGAGALGGGMIGLDTIGAGAIGAGVDSAERADAAATTGVESGATGVIATGEEASATTRAVKPSSGTCATCAGAGARNTKDS